MKVSLKTLFSKYKFKIIGILILAYLIFFFTPAEYEYYLDQDIQFFKRNYYWKYALMGSGIIISAIFLFGIFNKWKKKELFSAVLNASAICLIFFILMQMVTVAIFLFTNRMIPLENYTTTYKVEHVSESHLKINNIQDAADYIIAGDSEIIFNQIPVDRLKEGDTIILKFQKGLWKIRYL
jgi:hypothetical protein